MGATWAPRAVASLGVNDCALSTAIVPFWPWYWKVVPFPKGVVVGQRTRYGPNQHVEPVGREHLLGHGPSLLSG